MCLRVARCAAVRVGDVSDLTEYVEAPFGRLPS